MKVISLLVSYTNHGLVLQWLGHNIKGAVQLLGRKEGNQEI